MTQRESARARHCNNDNKKRNKKTPTAQRAGKRRRKKIDRETYHRKSSQCIKLFAYHLIALRGKIHPWSKTRGAARSLWRRGRRQTDSNRQSSRLSAHSLPAVPPKNFSRCVIVRNLLFLEWQWIPVSELKLITPRNGIPTGVRQSLPSCPRTAASHWEFFRFALDVCVCVRVLWMCHNFPVWRTTKFLFRLLYLGSWIGRSNHP